jgi:16S rRNA (guanine1516-N2)-methyltransferase
MQPIATQVTVSASVAAQLPTEIALPIDDNDEVDEHHWRLSREPQGLTLKGQLEGQPFKLCFDLLSGEMRYRQRFGGGRKEPLARAIGLKANPSPKVIDATAGMGREAFLLASLGCQVIAVERNPIIFVLLDDAIRRALNEPRLPFTQQQLKLVYQNSIDYLGKIDTGLYDVIYLDPMFPAREKSAAVKKEMRVFKRLAGEDLDDQQLLSAALKTASQRVVVKRPNYAPPIGDIKPSFQIKSKKHRFDVYQSTSTRELNFESAVSE